METAEIKTAEIKNSTSIKEDRNQRRMARMEHSKELREAKNEQQKLNEANDMKTWLLNRKEEAQVAFRKKQQAQVESILKEAPDARTEAEAELQARHIGIEAQEARAIELQKQQKEREVKLQAIRDYEERTTKEINLLRYEDDLDVLYATKAYELEELQRERIRTQKARAMLDKPVDSMSAAEMSRLRQADPVRFERELLKMQSSKKYPNNVK